MAWLVDPEIGGGDTGRLETKKPGGKDMRMDSWEGPEFEKFCIWC